MCAFDQEKLKELLTKFDAISEKSIKNDINFFDVAGYPHYENVASNILAFYFDTNQEHLLNNLWIKSLLDACGKNATAYFDCKIEREYNTSKNNRIDILIEFSDKIIVIENKIYAGLYNDLEDYKNTAENLLKNNESVKNNQQSKEILLVLLSLNKIINKDLGSFINITYEQLFYKIKDNIGHYVVDANPKWIIYMNEFMRNITSLMENNKMDLKKELQLIYKNNNDDIIHYLSVIKSDFNNKNTFFDTIYKILSNESFKDKLETYKISNEYISGIGGVFITTNDKIEFGTYYDRENHPEIVKFGIRNKQYSNNYCRDEINKIKEKCPDLNINTLSEKDNSKWKYVVFKEVCFADENCEPDKIAKVFNDIANAIM